MYPLGHQLEPNVFNFTFKSGVTHPYNPAGQQTCCFEASALESLVSDDARVGNWYMYTRSIVLPLLVVALAGY